MAEIQIPKALLPAWNARVEAVDKLHAVAMRAMGLMAEVHNRTGDVHEAMQAAEWPADPEEGLATMDALRERLAALNERGTQIQRAMKIAQQKTNQF